MSNARSTVLQQQRLIPPIEGMART